MNTEKACQSFWQNGYLVLEDFFDSELMDRIDSTIRSHFGDNPEFRHEEEFLSKSSTEVIPWFPQNPDLPEYVGETAALFNRLEENRDLAHLTGALIGEDWRPLYSMVMFSKKGTVGQAWHQDCAPENPEKFNMNRLVYSRDLTHEIGGQTVVMPGSHRKGLLPAGEPHEALEGQVVLKPRKGTLVLLHGHTWHRVLPIKGAFRFSTNYRACPASTPADITDICVYRNMRYCFSSNSIVEDRLTAT
jgi:ectoine hydroxylase